MEQEWHNNWLLIFYMPQMLETQHNDDYHHHNDLDGADDDGPA